MSTAMLFRAFTLSICFALPSVASAAGIINFTMSPATPGQHEPVTLTLESFAVDLTGAEIVWYENGAPIQEGRGLVTYKTFTKGFGETILIDVVITDGQKRRYDEQFKLGPIEIDILWEAKTYTPPFYKGKALPTYKSNVSVVAIPRFLSDKEDPSQFRYSWRFNTSRNAGEGVGVNSAMVPMGYSGTRIPVSVDVLHTDGVTKGRASVDIQATQPSLVIYEDAPLLGLRLSRAITSAFTPDGSVALLKAVPYFFSVDDMERGAILFRWNVDGRDATSLFNPRSLTLTRSTDSAQSHGINLSAQNTTRILQEASTGISVNFTSDQR